MGNGGFATIQAAINAAVAGDTIMLAAGTYNENIVLDRAVTILGANHGVMGTGARGAESVITGGFEITGAGAVIDGVKVTGGAPAFGSTDAIHVSAGNVTVTNSVLQGSGVADTFGLETENSAGITGLTISNNLIAGWNEGVSLGQGTGAAITGNTLRDMADLALRLDGPAATTTVTGNFFINNTGPGGHIGVGVFDGNLDVSTIIGANTLDASGGRSASSPMTTRRRRSPALSSPTSCRTTASAARRRPSTAGPGTTSLSAAPAMTSSMAASVPTPPSTPASARSIR